MARITICIILLTISIIGFFQTTGKFSFRKVISTTLVYMYFYLYIRNDVWMLLKKFLLLFWYNIHYNWHKGYQFLNGWYMENLLHRNCSSHLRNLWKLKFDQMTYWWSLLISFSFNIQHATSNNHLFLFLVATYWLTVRNEMMIKHFQQR
jgi:hypothetical protein